MEFEDLLLVMAVIEAAENGLVPPAGGDTYDDAWSS